MLNIIFMITKIIKLFDRIILFNLLKKLNLFRLKHRKTIKRNTFEGWGMITKTIPPWILISNNEVLQFEKTNNKLIALIKDKKFDLSLFTNNFNNDKEKIQTSIKAVEELKWRHYIVYFSILFIKKFTRNKINIVECGTCDGLSIFYAVNALSNENIDFTAYIFDSWAGMKKEHLLFENELRHLNDYSYLNLENTKNNLKEYSKNLIYNVGYIPEIFQSCDIPNNISWLHIDLNSSMPTLKSFEFCYDKLASNGIILLDDYGHGTYESTRTVSDKFFEDKNGQFINLPTGQGIFFKV